MSAFRANARPDQSGSQLNSVKYTRSLEDPLMNSTDDLLSGLFNSIVSAIAVCFRHSKSSFGIEQEPKNKHRQSDFGDGLIVRSNNTAPLWERSSSIEASKSLGTASNILAETACQIVLCESAFTSGKAERLGILSPDLYHSVAEILRDIGRDLISLRKELSLLGSQSNDPYDPNVLESWLEKAEYVLQSELTEPIEDVDLLIETSESYYDEEDDNGDGRDLVHVNIPKDGLVEHAHSLAENTSLLMSLLPSMNDLPQSMAMSSDTKKLRMEDFKVSEPARAWVSQIRDSYQEASKQVVERLGEANWQRFCRLRLKQDHEIANQLGQAKSVFHTSTFYDSALGTSLASKSDVKSVISHSSLASSNNDSSRNRNRVPNEPAEVAMGKTFMCEICGSWLVGIRNRIDWKMHVFKDLEPYICLHHECDKALSSFTTRKEWAMHDLHDHRRSVSYSCRDCGCDYESQEAFNDHVQISHDSLLPEQKTALMSAATNFIFTEAPTWKCPLCHASGFATARKYTSHTCAHMEDIALSTLPREMYHSDDEGDSSDSHASTSPLQELEAAKTLEEPSSGVQTAQPPILKDALSYLDSVKTKFADQPHVYNSFLDIMRDFKSGATDTPGVISRIAKLFEGYDDLIENFNIFCPPGYRIKVNRLSTLESAAMTVPTPIQPLPTNHPTQADTSSDSTAKGVRDEPLEFRHAVAFVNKVKHRYALQPDVYKRFLEILQQYQRESKPIHEVYTLVAELFRNSPDLIEDLKQFLPEKKASSIVPARKPSTAETAYTANTASLLEFAATHRSAPASSMPLSRNRRATSPVQPSPAPRSAPSSRLTSAVHKIRLPKIKVSKTLVTDIPKRSESPIDLLEELAPADSKRKELKPKTGL